MIDHSPRRAADVSDGEIALAVHALLGDHTGDAVRILKAFRDALAAFDMPWNPALVDPDLLTQPLARFPTGQVPRAIAGLCWKRNAPIKTELTKISDQPAKPCQTLRDAHGFVFAGNNRRWTFRDDGVDYRRIQGLGDIGDDERSLIVLSKKGRERFFAGKTDPFLGTAATLEIDHRTPAKAARKVGIPPDTLSDSDLDDGSADERFQALNKTTNTRKREVCEKCLEGADIELPPVAALGKMPGYWRIRFQDPRADGLPGEPSPCLGCIWHRPEHSFEQACQRWIAQHSNALPTQETDSLAGRTHMVWSTGRASLRPPEPGTISPQPPSSPED